MNIQNLIRNFLGFFKQRGYQVELKNKIVHHDNNDLLFINSGIAGIFNQFIESKITKLATIQQCLRIDGKHNDFDNIGTSKSHFCSFKMLGTFSNTNTDVATMIKDIYDFLNSLFSLKGNIYVTVHPDDNVSPNIWHSIDPKLEVVENTENFWSLKNTGPFGYCTEIMYKNGANDLELWNIVMVDRIIHEDGNHTLLPNIMIDTGGGLERIYSVFEDRSDIYFSDNNFDFMNNMLHCCDIASAKIMLDSIRAISSMLDSGVVISNSGHGYILKKIVRRLVMTVSKHKDVNLSNLIYHASLHINKIKEFIYIYRTEYAALKKCEATLVRHMQNKKVVTAAEVSKLHDTYGVHYQYTLEYAKTLNIEAPDVKEIEQNIYTVSVDSTKAVQMPDLKISNTEFIYSDVESKIEKVELLNDEYKIVQGIQNNQNFMFVVPATTFYPEGGGQDSDRGFIFKENNYLAEITGAVKKGNIVLHHAKALADIELKDLIEAKIIIDLDRRKRLGSSHTMHHFILAAVENIIGDKVFQQSSQIKADKTTVTFYSVNKLTKILTAEDLTNEINNLIENGEIKIVINYMDKQKAIDSRYKMLLMPYSDTVRGIDIFYNNKLFSKELCGGTHMFTQDFKVRIELIQDVTSYNTKLVYRLVWN